MDVILLSSTTWFVVAGMMVSEMIVLGTVGSLHDWKVKSMNGSIGRAIGGSSWVGYNSASNFGSGFKDWNNLKLN